MLKKVSKKLDLRIFTTFVTIILLSVICVISVSAMFDTSFMEITVTEIDDFADKNSTRKIWTNKTNVKDFLEAHGIEIGMHDVLNLAESSPISKDTEIIITRGMPITIQADGHITLCSTTKATVGEALLETGNFPDEDDILSHDLNAPVSPELTVSITRIENQNIVVTEEIPNSTEYKDDNTLAKGKTKVLQEGNKGITEITYKIVYNNGVEVSREEISRVVTKEPKNRIIANGTKTVKTAPVKNTQTQKASGSVSGLNFSKKLTMSATGYTAFRSDGSRAKTASGKTARYGLVAVDPKVIPLGTKLYIEGYGEAVAADTGGAIKGNKIDLCFEMSNAQIRKQFGRKTVTVYILD